MCVASPGMPGATLRTPLPDPEGFLAAAVRIAEAGDADTAIALYAEDAVFEIVNDGAHQRFAGLDEVARAQRALMTVFRARHARFAKSLTAATETTIVNEWRGRVAGSAAARGTEIWEFNADGKVRRHRLYSFLNVKPSTSPLAQLRIALAYPRTALTMAASFRRHGAQRPGGRRG